MKKCLKCGQIYSDETLNFCLNDGELLVRDTRYAPPPTQPADDSPPTLVMEQPRVTNPIDFAPSSAIPWQNQTPQMGQPLGIFGYLPPDQTLPTISLVLGIASCFAVCCLGGIWLGLPALVVGFLATRNIAADPARYGGRGRAIAGMVLGIITFVASLFILILGSLS